MFEVLLMLLPDIFFDQIDEDRREFNPFIPMAIVLGLFVVSGVISYSEIRYALWGRTTDATIVRMKETAFSAGEGEGPLNEVVYNWNDKDDGHREDAFLQPTDWGYKKGDTFEIDYLPGVKKSRIAGTPLYAKISLGFFFGLGALALILFAMLWRKGTRESRQA